ncbi:MAG: oxidoreductase FAD/NAD(P)-binding domain protein [Candidatus Scalindua rubra]|uniref:Oxidoreductase FAD/NAD(P)-binding domain protein n=1 Tax=Candidatus Scalindua rubra TaxID=1872076 RepID=A0A1E3XBN5_9BACT|nr:MAG: oxidoreductase FAD/NAD(P)-binding domain protein [Candidatus Scalindua rubra]
MINNDSLFLPEIAEVVSTRQLTDMEKYFELRPKNQKEFGFNPGQFVQLSIFGIGEAPISISSSPFNKDSIGICVRRVGDVTSAIHKLEVGSSLGIRGPLGNGFPIEEMIGKDILFIAGGLGLAPLRSMISYVFAKRNDFRRITILYGVKNPREILFVDDLEAWKERNDIEMDIIVDKPDEKWTGKSGVITRLIPPLTLEPLNTYALIVGPPVMYKYVLLELKIKQIPENHIIMSLERRMKCGVGKCGHCQINGVYVCLSGPEFNYQTLKFLSEAI